MTGERTGDGWVRRYARMCAGNGHAPAPTMTTCVRVANEPRTRIVDVVMDSVGYGQRVE